MVASAAVIPPHTGEEAPTRLRLWGEQESTIDTCRTWYTIRMFLYLKVLLIVS